MLIDTKDIIPSGSRLLIAPDEKATETDGGLIIAGDEKNTAPVKGTVIAVGPKASFEVGSVVLFRRYSIDELKIDDGTGEQVVYFLEDSDILGTVKVELPVNKEVEYPKIVEKKELDEIKNASKETTSSNKL